MTATMTRQASAVTIDRYPATAVPTDMLDDLLALTLPHGEMAKVFGACSNPARPAWIGRVLVAKLDGNIVGWALRWRLSEISDWSLHLYVHPTHRRAGVGSALVEAARHRLRSRTRLDGFVWDDTSAAFWDASRNATVGATDLRRH